MKKSASTLLLLLLVTAIVAAPLAGQDTLMQASHEQPAGCHRHGAVPVPQPVNYRCCQAGHDIAILQFSFSSQPDFTDLAPQVEQASILVLNILHKALHNAPSSADPPGIAPLRV